MEDQCANLLYFYTLPMNTLKIKSTPFTVAPEGVKCLGTGITKGVKHLPAETYKTLKRNEK